MLTEATFGAPEPWSSPTGDRIRDLGGATVDARDTFEWHLAGGAELTFKRKWSVFVDLRWTFASRTLHIGFNGGDDLGVPVPQTAGLRRFRGGHRRSTARSRSPTAG